MSNAEFERERLLLDLNQILSGTVSRWVKHIGHEFAQEGLIVFNLNYYKKSIVEDPESVILDDTDPELRDDKWKKHWLKILNKIPKTGNYVDDFKKWWLVANIEPENLPNSTISNIKYRATRHVGEYLGIYGERDFKKLEQIGARLQTIDRYFESAFNGQDRPEIDPFDRFAFIVSIGRAMTEQYVVYWLEENRKDK